jgi:3-oxoacyl-[acyl-carrier-protein] synthase-1
VWDGFADPAIPPLALVEPGDAFAGTAGGEAMLSNSFAFGGSNVALVLGRNEVKRT